jgi:CRISPR-associated protein Cas2
MYFLLSYDVTKNRSRKKVSELLEELGVRVQKSVFECDISKSQLVMLMQKTEELIDTSSDSVIFYQICKNCIAKRDVVGTAFVLKKVKTQLISV